MQNRERGQRIIRGDTALLRAYAGVDPSTGKRDYKSETVPLSVGPRELDRRQRALVAKADALAAERRHARLNQLTPKEQAALADQAGDDMTFGELAEDWYAAHRDQLQPGGQSTPRFILDAYLLPTLAPVELWRVRATVPLSQAARCPDLVSIKALYDHLEKEGGAKGQPLEPGTLQRVHGILKQVLGYAVQRGWLTGNPAREARPSPYRRKQRPLPDQRNMDLYLDYLADKHPAVETVALLVMSGLRPNEALALRLNSIDLETGIVTAGAEGIVHVADAGGRRTRGQVVEGDTEKRRWRRVRLSRHALASVQRQLQRVGTYAAMADVTPAADAFLFSPVPDATTHYEPGWAGQAFERWARRAVRDGAADLPAGMVLYDVRHFAISRLLEAGHPVAKVAERFATSARMIYATYAHSIPSGDDLMADTLDRVFDTDQ